VRYTAHGLQLDSTFPLPGMRAVVEPTDAHLPTLTLARCAPEQLGWNGAGARTEWHGHLGDGLDLVIDAGDTGDLLFTYGDRALFHLNNTMSSLDCAPRHDSLDWQRALIGKVLPSISVMRGYEALHSASVDSPHGVVAIMAPSGAGKSTLGLELMSRGWPLFADDVLTLEHLGETIRAHPGTPHMNLDERLPDGVDPATLGETLATLGGEHWFVARSRTTSPRPVRLLCLVERGPGRALEAVVEPSNPLALAPYMLGLSTDPERQRSRFELYADLMDSATLVRLTAGLEHRPEQLADLIEAVVARQPQSSERVPR
jgi:hypothetical protein